MLMSQNRLKSFNLEVNRLMSPAGFGEYPDMFMYAGSGWEKNIVRHVLYRDNSRKQESGVPKNCHLLAVEKRWFKRTR